MAGSKACSPAAAMCCKLNSAATWAVWVYALCTAVKMAYNIRLKAIHTYGYVIHEFDPWFNMRATQYLADNGLYEFFHWFDRKSWYPLGRPVGTTIYPGMQMTAVALWRSFGWARAKGLLTWWAHVARAPISLNDVCCLVPAWFGGSATVFLSLLTLETTNSYGASAMAALVMSIIPAHLMRSVGGGYDNESIALTAMTLTFWLWTRSLRAPRGSDAESAAAREDGRATTSTWVFGALAGLGYVYMVAAWGGFTFVVNCVGAHAFALVCIGRYTRKLRVAYTVFYVLGTAGAVMVPVVGWRPLRDMELLPPLLVVIGLQFYGWADARRVETNKPRASVEFLGDLVKAGAALGVMLVVAAAILFPLGYFGPLSSRVRGLFLKHTRTGNPLVDSVAEHQPASTQAYTQYLHHAYYIVPYGLCLSILHVSDATIFIWVYAAIAYSFANKMARLIILTGPIASILVGVAAGAAVDHLFINAAKRLIATSLFGEEADGGDDDDDVPEPEAAPKKKTKKGAANAASAQKQRSARKPRLSADARFLRSCRRVYGNPLCCVARLAVFAYMTKERAIPAFAEFYDYCDGLSEGLSQPSIMFKATLKSGKEIIVDDYREAYWWLRDNTKEDARVLSWWDYGYQITGIGERTTLADGNTWNHEHIATLGRILTAPEKEAHSIARHMADYVLVWAGGGGDDLAKSPHMARIGNSVYHDICPDDPTCRHFGFYQGGQPSESMAASLLYKLTTHGTGAQTVGPPLNTSRWQPVFTSKFGKVRIYKIKSVSLKSKNWILENTLCDGGGWYCPGQYPPAIKWLIDKRKPFRQLEDFNTGKRSAADDEYQRKYKEKMEGGSRRPDGDAGKAAAAASGARVPKRVNFMGCYRFESDLPEAKLYGGGATGAEIHAAVDHAMANDQRYVAVARVGGDGHAFAFNAKPAGKALGFDDPGCGRPCEDDANFYCGCADAGCEGVQRAADEEYLRRWVVYDLGAPDAKKKSAKRPKKRTAPAEL